MAFERACRRFRYSKTAEGKPQLGRTLLGEDYGEVCRARLKTNDAQYYVQDKILSQVPL